MNDPRWRARACALLAATLAAPAAAAQERPPAAQVVRIPFPQDDGTLTPYTFEIGYPLVTLVYDTLLWRDHDGVPRPWLARSVETGEDGRRITLHLDEGARWHDGRAVTSADVAFTFDFVATRRHPRFTPALEAVERVDAPDPATAVIALRRPAAGFLDQPLADLPILPAHLWRDLPADRLAPEGLPVGSGPFRLTEHRPGEGYRFEANRSYFRGPPAVGALEVPIVPEVDETLAALRRRLVDMVPLSLPREVAAAVEALGTRVVEGPSYLGTVLMFNVREPPFDSAAARTAVAAALDLSRLARAAGEATPAERGYLHPDSAWAPDAVLHRFDPGAASRLAPELPAIEIVAPDNDPVRLEAGRQVVLALERAGVAASLRPLAQKDLSASVGEDGSPPTFQAAIWAAPALASYDPDFLSRVFGSRPEQAPFNYSGYASPDFDRAAALIATAEDASARREAVEEALRTLSDDLPVVPLFFPTGRYAYRPAVYDGWVFVKGSGIFDKRSFVEPAAPAPGGVAAGPTPDADGGGLSPLGLLALAVLSAALVLAASLAVASARRRA